MRKYLLGLFALVMAIGLSAFTTKKEKKNSLFYHWFYVTPGHGNQGSFYNAEVEYITYDDDVPVVSGCQPNPTGYKCAVGFDNSQVDGIDLDDNGGTSPQTPATQAGQFRLSN